MHEMIIVKDKNIQNSVYFPQNIYTNNTDYYTLTLRDRGTNKVYEFKDLKDQHLVSYDFYTFFVDFSSCPQGEYEYVIYDSNKETVATGIIRLNNLEPENVCYEAKFTYDTING